MMKKNQWRLFNYVLPLILVVMVFGILLAPSTSGVTYVKFRNVASNLYIDGMGSTSNGANACQWGNSNSNNQQWTLETVGSYYKIKNRATGLYLDGMGRTSNGSICGQWNASSSTNQQWVQETVGSYYKYKNAATGLYLDGMGSTSNGANLCQWSSSGSTNQQWRIETIAPTPTSPATPTPTLPGTPTPTSLGTPTPTPTLPTTSYLQRIEPANGFQINSTFWNARVKNIMVNWIPYLENQLSNTGLAEGGIQNFVNAGNKLAGRSYSAHVGYVFSNAYTLNTIEAMCAALMIDPRGDSAISSAQNAMRTKLADWIPKILSAQESDGYLQTAITLGGTRWSYNGNHEGYVAGYFIEAGIMHYLMTNKSDATLYNAAKKLADCWCNNIGPGKAHATWWDDHEEMEQALCRLGVFVNQNEGAGKGDKYIQLAKILLDNRHGGSAYCQAQDYPYNQRTVVGHAVRSMYLCSGMTDVAMLLNASNYITAVNALWDNFVNRKLYVTGGVGSGETSEGYGADYSLPNASAYCESCAGCGALFFQNKMNLLYGDGKYADLMELEFYNAILGSLDLGANNFTYTNSLDTSGGRYKWHNCPCCVGNIPKTILEFARWMYAKSGDSNSLYVNMYIGSTYTVSGVAGTDVQLVQTTNYPWENNVTITVNLTTAKAFTIYLHSPDFSVSACYSSTPIITGLSSVAVNGVAVSNTVSKGYVAINRTWTAGDKITFTIPLAPQRVKAVSNVAADAGRVALQYGPLIYNLESVDQNVDLILNPSSMLTTQWNGSLLDGVITIKGTFTNGAAMTAIPNYARLNRGGRSLVWLKDQ